MTGSTAEYGLLGYAPVLPGFAIRQITNTPKGDFIQQRPEPGEAFEVLSNNFKTHLERTVKTRTSNFNNLVDVSK